MKKILLILGLLLSVVLISGCLSVSEYTTIQKDGSIGDIKMVMNTSSYVYGLMNSSSQSQGYTSFKDSMITNFTKDYQGLSAPDVTYSEVHNGDYVIITMEARGSFQPSAGSGVQITKDANSVTYSYTSTSTSPTSQLASNDSSETSSMSDAMLNGIKFDYYVYMPGKITDTNANVTNGNTAEWHFTGSNLKNMNYLYARSDISSSPGFETIIALSGLVVGGYFVAMRRKKD